MCVHCTCYCFRSLIAAAVVLRTVYTNNHELDLGKFSIAKARTTHLFLHLTALHRVQTHTHRSHTHRITHTHRHTREMKWYFGALSRKNHSSPLYTNAHANDEREHISIFESIYKIDNLLFTNNPSNNNNKSAKIRPVHENVLCTEVL